MKFEVLVIGPEVGRQLAPYAKRTRVGAFRRYITEDELQDGIMQGMWAGRLGPDADEAAIAAYVRSTFDEFLGERDEIDKDERGWYFYSHENPLARWDYWFVNSEWWPLRTRPGGAVVLDEAAYAGWPDIRDHARLWRRGRPGEVLYGAQSVVEEIDFVAMERESAEAAGRAWDAYQAAEHRDSLDEIQIGGFTREEYLLRTGWHPACLVEGGRWHERGDRGLRADVEEARALEWRRFVDDLIGGLPPGTLLTKVVCHT
ncbi:hypothetical protein [Nonomuraea sp. NPDC049607]|uniref:hypothetical protein n=1 Tax=Nonomuraea sp. NPDC049607 TaxID=3154732 RepID=UPI003432649B